MADTERDREHREAGEAEERIFDGPDANKNIPGEANTDLLEVEEEDADEIDLLDDDEQDHPKK
jgi:hypothetical protein